MPLFSSRARRSIPISWESGNGILFSFRNSAKSFGNTLQCRPIPTRYHLMIPCATQRLAVSPETWQILAISNVVNAVFFIFIMWTMLNIFDGLVKSNKSDGTGKSSRCKACESLVMRRTYQYAAVTKR